MISGICVPKVSLQEKSAVIIICGFREICEICENYFPDKNIK